MEKVQEMPRWSRATFGIGLALISFCMVIFASNPTTNTYEFSLWQAYPLAFWVGLVAAVACGQLLILRNALTPQRRYWKLGFVVISLVNIILLSQPHIRYTLYGRGDALTHIGYVRRIVATGTIMETNFYPVFHVLAALTTELTALAPKDAVTLLPVIFSVIYFGSFVYLLYRLAPSLSSFLFALPVSLLPLLGKGHTFAFPSAVSFFLTPLIICLFLRLHDGEKFRTYAFLFTLLILIMIPFHPMTFLYMLSALVMLRLMSVVATHVNLVSLESQSTIRVPVLLLGGVLFLWWYSTFTTTILTGFDLLNALLGRTGGGQFDHLTGVASTYSPSLFDLLIQGVTRFGLLGTIVGGTTVLLGWRFFHSIRSKQPVDSSIVAFAIVFVAFVVISAAAFFADLVFSYDRFVRPVYLSAPILIGVSLSFADDRIDRPALRRIGGGVLIASLLFLVVFSMINLHPSPMTKDANKQVTAMEIEGSEWFYEFRDQSVRTDELGFKQFRFFSISSDEITREEPYDVVVLSIEQNIRLGGTAPPDHFGYDENESVAVTYDEERYLLLTEPGKKKYPNLYPGYEQFWRFNQEDFQRLNNDPGADYVYDNGEFEAYYIHGS
ncbi:hypothetical protein SAMN05443574_1168 [Haloarcula vallismortis]|uniref:Glycosyltransferase RgtA/B/C/D-like domain-containing protein n=2 Tax=Haloarcula vallismortis TaxID=28442 RepID=M0J9H4_HALVA|nr:hypothetical protein [Haloarcula vallismortis]EMA04649.1 hypothetical protein C437_13920 [Haloarcula vallismortis ATCC 29715]SDX15240.1 hypothetical protein SAMN05443574_1168 [Haloarcula vallismortis]